jgi:hypothetical protein
MENKLNGHDAKMMPIAMEDVKKAYMERVYAMSHAELFHELMRVHTESARLLQMAEGELKRLQERIEQYEPIH